MTLGLGNKYVRDKYNSKQETMIMLYNINA